MGVGEQVRWWAYPGWQTWPARVAAWLLVAWGIVGPAAVPGFAELGIIELYIPMLVVLWFSSRTTAVAIGLDGKHLYLRRLFLGRVEQIPFAEIKGCAVLRGMFAAQLRIRGPWRLWFGMGQASQLPVPRVPDWEGLLHAVQAAFEPPGKWEDAHVWWF